MSASNRSAKLFVALSARERSLLVLRAWKAGRPGQEDRQVRATMPDSQGAEFNELIAIMNGVNGDLGPYILLLRATVEKLGLIVGWLATIDLWGDQVVELGSFIFRLVPEPITESDYQRLKKGRAKPRPEWGLRFEPLPDSQVAEVKRLREERAHVMKTVQKAPWGGLVDESSDEKLGFGDEIRNALIDRLKNGWIDRYSEMLAIEAFLVEAAEAFDGEDPALPEIRAILDWMHPELEEIHGTLRDRYRVDIALPELDPERLAVIQKVARWPETKRDIAESIRVKLLEALSDEVEDQPDDDPKTAPDAGE